MGFHINDFSCLDCNNVFEEIYSNIEEVKCGLCNSYNLEKKLSVPNIGAFSAASIERKQEILKTRSAKDTQKQVMKEPERWGKEGIDRAKRNKNPQIGYTGK